jgi:hypothetical protein
MPPAWDLAVLSNSNHLIGPTFDGREIIQNHQIPISVARSRELRPAHLAGCVPTKRNRELVRVIVHSLSEEGVLKQLIQT